MYEEVEPPGPLRGVARCVWRSAAAGPKRIVPDGCLDLVAGDGEVFVAGPDTSAWSSVTRPGALLSGVRFLPGRAAAVLGVAADELRDRRVPLGELWGRAGQELAERLLAGELSPARAVASRLGEVPPPDPAVAELIARLDAGAARVADAAAAAGLTRSGGGDAGMAARLGGSGQEAARAAAMLARSGAAGMSRAQAAAMLAQAGPVGMSSAQAALLAQAGTVGMTAAQAAATLAQAGTVGMSSAQAALLAQAGRVGMTAAQAALLARSGAAGMSRAQAAAMLGGSGPEGARAAAGVAQPARSGGSRPEVVAGRVEDPAASVAVSERRLRRRFVQAVGYGPATYLRVSRFQRAVALAPRVAGLAALAAAAGYADQAHLSRDCRALTGLTPRGYFGEPSTVDVAVRDRRRSA
ncbi:helix-turn-helix domain-containing protein [Amycolatopsis sp. NPDC051045]|uniref:helix-turn-helix domain-containing protein n=1 Tax=Amycolatopsis sp. NPDC051045 TaxID=3156922 RepID=UPI00341FCBC0